MTVIHKHKVMAGIVLCTILMAGCSKAPKVPAQIEQTSIVIAKDGMVTHHMVDSFDKEHYRLEELKQMAVNEAAAYNTARQTGTEPLVTLKETALIDGQRVLVTYQYDTTKTYADYNSSELFYGTVKEAGEAGYHFEALNQVLYGADGKSSMVSSDIADSVKDSRHVVIVEGNALVYCPYQVAYASENAVVKEDGSVDTSGVLPGEYPVIILLDK